MEKAKVKRYALYLGGGLALLGIVAALIQTQSIAPGHSGTMMGGTLWLWSGILRMLDRYPKHSDWDRWEKRVYGLAGIVMGVSWLVVGYLPWDNMSSDKMLWHFFFLFIPALLVAIAGRLLYVNPMRKRCEEECM